MRLQHHISHLACYHPRPKEGEEVPIQFIGLEEKIAGWSPDLKMTVYVDDLQKAEGLKRIREIFLLKVYNWLSDGQSVIELTNAERMQFEDVMTDLLLHGGEIRYTRKKSGRKMFNHFRLERAYFSHRNIREGVLVDKLQ